MPITYSTDIFISKTPDGVSISTNECKDQTNQIYLCNSERDIPISFCTRFSEDCESGISQEYASWNDCIGTMNEEIGDKTFLVTFSQEVAPQCIDSEKFFLAIQDDSEGIHKAKLLQYKIQTFDTNESCHNYIKENTFYVCNPINTDSNAFCTNNKDECELGYYKKVLGQNNCIGAVNQYSNDIDELGYYVCQTPNDIFYVPYALRFGTNNCGEGHKIVSRIKVVDILSMEGQLGTGLYASLNKHNFALCGKNTFSCIDLKSEGDIASYFQMDLLDHCTSFFDEEVGCHYEALKLNKFNDNLLCYDEIHDNIYCRENDMGCRYNEYRYFNNPISQEACKDIVDQSKDTFTIQCKTDDSEILCIQDKQDLARCTWNSPKIIHETKEKCLDYIKKDNSLALYQDTKGNWRCGSTRNCPEMQDQNLRFFYTWERCENIVTELNVNNYYLYLDKLFGKDYYDCDDSITSWNFASCNANVEEGFTTKEGCYNQANTKNREIFGIKWYRCINDEKNFICTDDLSKCNFDEEFSLRGTYPTEGECMQELEEIEQSKWYICYDGASYSCKYGSYNCVEEEGEYSTFWKCTQEKEKIEPTTDNKVKAIFVPVNWNGLLEEFEYYSESQFQYLLNTADISGVDLSGYDIEKVVISRNCEVDNIMSMNIDNQVLDCVLNRLMDFNPTKDKIIALTDADMGNRLGYTSENFPFLNIVKYEMKIVLAHELGHSLFKLCDEYSFDAWKRQNDERSCPNLYPECCFDNPDNKEEKGNNCYPDIVSDEDAKESLCAGTICSPSEEKYCRSIMGPGISLYTQKKYFGDSLERKYPQGSNFIIGGGAT